jgi:hypothetical protein
MHRQSITSEATVPDEKSTVLITFEGNNYIIPLCFKKQDSARILQLMKRMATNIAENYGLFESLQHVIAAIEPLYLLEWDLTGQDLHDLNSKRNEIDGTVISKLWEQWAFLHRNLQVFSGIADAIKECYKETKYQKSVHKNLYRMSRLGSLRNKYIQDGNRMTFAKEKLEEFENLVYRSLKAIEKVETLIEELHNLSKVTDAVYKKGVDDSFHRSIDSYLNKD